MNYAVPIWLGGCLAVALPILIHLRQQSPTSKIEVGTLRFLPKSQSPRARWSKPKDWLLLLLRCACILLLAGIFARPYLPAPEQPKRQIHVFDRSASMSAKAVHFSSLLKSGADSLFSEEPIVALNNNVTATGQLPPTGGRANFNALAQWALAEFNGKNAAGSEIVVHTDLQAGNLPKQPLRWPRGLSLRFEPQPPLSTNNVAVTAIKLLSWDPITNLARVETRWRTFGTMAERELQLTLSATGLPAPDSAKPDAIATTDPSTVRLQAPLSANRAVAEIRCPKTAVVHFETRLENAGDPWGFDDFRGALHCLNQGRMLLIDPNGNPSALTPTASYFLLKALGTEADEARRFVVSYSKTIPHSIENHDLVTLCDPQTVDPPAIESLKRFVKAGGGLLLFAGAETSAVAVEMLREAGLLPIELKRTQPSLHLLARWDSATLGTALDGADPSDTPVLSTWKAGRESGSNATVLAEGADGQPLIVFAHCGKGRVVISLFSPERNRAELPLNPFFVPLFRALAVQAFGTSAIQLGEGEIADPLAPLLLRKDGRLILLNPPLEESDPTFLSREEFASRIGIPDPKSETPDDGSASKRELWPPLAILLMALLALESVIQIVRERKSA